VLTPSCFYEVEFRLEAFRKSWRKSANASEDPKVPGLQRKKSVNRVWEEAENGADEARYVDEFDVFRQIGRAPGFPFLP
jgi:hypothetical protein